MKIGFISPYVCRRRGGGERLGQMIINGLAERGYDVIVAHLGGSGGYSLSPKVKQCIGKFELPVKRFSIYRRIFLLYPAIRKMKALKPDVVLAIGSISFLLFFKGEGYKRIFMVTYPYETQLENDPNWFKRNIYYKPFLLMSSKAKKNVDIYIAISNYVERSLGKQYAVKSVVIYPPVDDLFKPHFNKKREDLVLYISRFAPAKYQLDAIKMFVSSKLNEKYKLVLCGNHFKAHEWYSKKVVQEAKRYKNIEIKIVSSDDELVSLYQSATVFWFPRKPYRGVSEHFGLCVVESLACGTPVIAYNCGGPKEIIINNQTGFLVNNSEEFINKTKFLLKERKMRERMSFNSARRGSKFSKEKFLNEIETIIQ